MAQTRPIPGGIRLLAALASCSAILFSAIYLTPFLLLGAIIQPWARTTGRWLMWLGALLVSVLVVPYGPAFIVSWLKHPPESSIFSIFPLFVLATLVVYCCDIALIVEAVKSKGNPWSRGKLDSVVWVAASILSAWCVWAIQAMGYAYTHLGIESLFPILAFDAVVIAFDVGLILHALKTRRIAVAM